jgi:hypothetical protein
MSRVHFIALCKKGRPNEIMEVLLRDIQEAQSNGIPSYDPITKRKCLIIPILACVLADNPRAAELASVRGCSGVAPCRFCYIKVSQIKEGDHESRMRTLENAVYIRDVANAFPTTRKEAYLKKYGLQKEISAFEKILVLGFNNFSDFPVEVLHTVLLVRFSKICQQL